MNSYPIIFAYQFQGFYNALIQNKIMILAKGIYLKLYSLIGFGSFKHQIHLIQPFHLQNVDYFCFSQRKSQQMFFSQKSNGFEINKNLKEYQSLQSIKDKIDFLNLKLSKTEELNQLNQVIYPQALFSGEENVCKLQAMYQAFMRRLQEENLQHKHFQHLVMAGDFYSKIHVRRLKALKPYLKAKYLMEKNFLQQKIKHESSYIELCKKIEKLIKQDITEGECETIQQYFKQGLQNQKNGNQLQALYYYYKGICISEYEKIPDKLLHLEMLSHYTYLCSLMKPKSKNGNSIQHYQCCLQKYQQIQILFNKWWKQQFQNSKDLERKQKFEQIMIWTFSNKGNTLCHAKAYAQAIKYYEKVIEFYKIPENVESGIKIVKIIENLQNCYKNVGQTKKALSVLEWAHSVIQKQASKNISIRVKYLKPLDEALIKFYHSYCLLEQDNDYLGKIDIIKRELNQITH